MTLVRAMENIGEHNGNLAREFNLARIERLERLNRKALQFKRLRGIQIKQSDGGRERASTNEKSMTVDQFAQGSNEASDEDLLLDINGLLKEISRDKCPESSSSQGGESSPASVCSNFEEMHVQEIEERICQLEEEEQLVRKQLEIINKKRGALVENDTTRKRLVAASCEKDQAPLEISGTCADIHDKNTFLKPLIVEYRELATKLREGTKMKALVDRKSSTYASVDIRLNQSLTALCWGLDYDKHSRGNRMSRDDWCKANSYCVELEHVAAVFCVEKAQQGYAFRVHLEASPIGDEHAEPLEFIADSSEMCQDWVVGIGVFHRLL